MVTSKDKTIEKNLKKWCIENFINSRSLRHARDIHRYLMFFAFNYYTIVLLPYRCQNFLLLDLVFLMIHKLFAVKFKGMFNTWVCRSHLAATICFSSGDVSLLLSFSMLLWSNQMERTGKALTDTETKHHLHVIAQQKYRENMSFFLLIKVCIRFKTFHGFPQLKMLLHSLTPIVDVYITWQGIGERADCADPSIVDVVPIETRVYRIQRAG